MTLPNYTQFGGFNPETAGLGHLLSYHGVVSPHDKKPFSEAMLRRAIESVLQLEA